VTKAKKLTAATCRLFSRAHGGVDIQATKFGRSRGEGPMLKALKRRGLVKCRKVRELSLRYPGDPPYMQRCATTVKGRRLYGALCDGRPRPR